ncbi:hypothetical protein [Actinomyces oricola]|uniref:hypothetical protein n=1 Tax=Actinomyces oricola TaxID=206043 RepID=UPI000FFED34C|nr:hypothetical protein [Actinomyces oricola]
MSEHDEVTPAVAREARMAFQVAMQIGRFFAEKRRQQLDNARRDSLAQARRVQETIRQQRIMASAALRTGLDDKFWDKAKPQDAAFIHGLATRFEDIDPLARQVAQRCRKEALARWGTELTSLTPVHRRDVPASMIAEVSPTLTDEENKQANQALDNEPREMMPEPAEPQVSSNTNWDSTAARDAWAKQKLKEGHDPQAVRSAVAGDRALHEPAHRASAPARPAAKVKSPEKSSPHQSRTQTRRA